MKRFFVIVLICLLASAVRADELVLKNGRKMQGRVTEVTDESVVLVIPGGTLVLKRSQVREIRRGYHRAERIGVSTSPVIEKGVKEWDPVANSGLVTGAGDLGRDGCSAGPSERWEAWLRGGA